MAQVRKPGRPREMKGLTFRREVEAYFDSISYEVPAMRKEIVKTDDGDIVLDDYGHPMMREVPIKTKDGREAMVTAWIEPPSIASLCLYLGISDRTFERYARLDPADAIDEDEAREFEELSRTAARARGRVKAYLLPLLEDRNAQRGVEFNLKANFSMNPTAKKEISLDEDTRKSVELGIGTTAAEKIAFLKEAGVDVSAWEDE